MSLCRSSATEVTSEVELCESKLADETEDVEGVYATEEGVVYAVDGVEITEGCA